MPSHPISVSLIRSEAAYMACIIAGTSAALRSLVTSRAAGQLERVICLRVFSYH